jgi:hypothetical protein
MQGLDADHHLRIEFDNVVFRDRQPQFSTVNTDLNVGKNDNARANACTGKFVIPPALIGRCKGGKTHERVAAIPLIGDERQNRRATGVLRQVDSEALTLRATSRLQSICRSDSMEAAPVRCRGGGKQDGDDLSVRVHGQLVLLLAFLYYGRGNSASGPVPAQWDSSR